MSEREVFNPATGERFWFSDANCDTQGRVRSLGYELLPGHSVPEHFHPGHAQIFAVQSGELHVAVGGQTLVLGSGQRASCAPGEPHRQWNEGRDPVVAIESYDPPLDIEPFFTHMAAMGARGELKAGGQPTNILKFATFVDDFRHVSPLNNSPLMVLLRVMAFVGRLVGLRNWYRR